MIFPCSKPCDLLKDAEALTPFYAMIDQSPAALDGQHPIRRWEYAMALAAIDQWNLARRERDGTIPLGQALTIGDVGGAGSNFWQVLVGLTSEPVLLIDPHAPPSGKPEGACLLYTGSVEEYAANYSHNQFDLLTCISVIEHVTDLRPFFRACHMLLKPGGLLFLTTDYWDAEGDDTAHFHWMRERIYHEQSLTRLITSVRELGFARMGASRWRPYPGPMVFDYSVASLALVRKEL